MPNCPARMHPTQNPLQIMRLIHNSHQSYGFVQPIAAPGGNADTTELEDERIGADWLEECCCEPAAFRCQSQQGVTIRASPPGQARRAERAGRRGGERSPGRPRKRVSPANGGEHQEYIGFLPLLDNLYRTSSASITSICIPVCCAQQKFVGI